MSKEISFDEIVKNSDRFTKWNYICPSDVLHSTGYEPYHGEPGVSGLKKYNSVAFYQADDAGKDEIINHCVDIYEKVGIFPIRYYSEQGAREEIIRVMESEVGFEGDTVSVVSKAGATLCSWMFPNLFRTPSSQDLDANGNPLSAYDKFYTREGLYKMISFLYNYNFMGDKVIADTGIDPLLVESPKYPALNPISGLRMTGSVPTNFKPLNAKAIYEHFVPKEGARIFDPCAGFSGRMLGALSSKYNYFYEATDPNTETVYNLNRMGKLIESVTGRENSFKIHCVGSEDFLGEPESYDFAFTSPPYFDLELYGSDGGDFNSEAQSHVRYPDLDSWLDGYVRQTVRNVYQMLKRRSYCAINIADFEVDGRMVNYVDLWREISAEEGLEPFDNLYLGIQARTGSVYIRDNDFSKKKENILVFKKRR